MSLLIAKVGGSLFDLPGLGTTLLHWVDQQPEEKILLVAGGGDFVEALRKYQRLHGLSDAEAHWLAIRTLGVSARMLAAMVGGWPVVAALGNESRAVLDCPDFLKRNGDALPESWDVTSDSIAALAGIRFGASRLVLLKSRAGNPNEAGYVDAHFGELAKGCEFPIECIDFRPSP